MVSSVLAFAWLALAMTLVPGADTIVVLRTSLRQGWRCGVVAALGIACGVVMWGGLAGAGVALMLSRLPALYAVVAVAGGIYLAHLAVRSFAEARGLWSAEHPGPEIGATPPGGRGPFATGLLTNLLNPKIGAFYLSVIPGLFIGETLTLWLGLALGGIHALWGIVCLSAVSTLAGWARPRLLRPRTRAVFEAACGAFLLLFGVIVIVEAVAQLR